MLREIVDGVTEETQVVTASAPLPFGQRWVWMADANLVLMCPTLDEAGREDALDELQAHWRRSCLRVVA